MNPPQLGLVIPANGKSGDYPHRPALGTIFGTGDHLGKVADDVSPMAVLVKALKDKGIGFDELDELYKNSTELNKGVVIVRGRGSEIIDRYFQGSKDALSGTLEGVQNHVGDRFGGSQ